ncbi:MAG: hypothetical protein KKE89_03445, partial [Actinobacteria bacterium]|nr:hypothetical protein [Actinomycetota bacterium]
IGPGGATYVKTIEEGPTAFVARFFTDDAAWCDGRPYYGEYDATPAGGDTMQLSGTGGACGGDPLGGNDYVTDLVFDRASGTHFDVNDSPRIDYRRTYDILPGAVYSGPAPAGAPVPDTAADLDALPATRVHLYEPTDEFLSHCGDENGVPTCHPTVLSIGAEEPLIIHHGFNGEDGDVDPELDRFALEIDGEPVVPSGIVIEWDGTTYAVHYWYCYFRGLPGAHTLIGRWYEDGDLTLLSERRSDPVG